MADNQRIEDLRRRVQKDPASIAFAQLAEECRRAAQFQEAVDVCRAGLQMHPGYLSARVTLGRTLIELNQLDEAQTELEHVLKNAAENLAAIRGLAEIHHRRGSLTDALAQYRAALALARNDPDLQQTVAELERAVEPPKPLASADGLSFEQAQAEFLKNLPPPPAPSPLAPLAAAAEIEPAVPEPAPEPKPWDLPAEEPKPWDLPAEEPKPWDVPTTEPPAPAVAAPLESVEPAQPLGARSSNAPRAPSSALRADRPHEIRPLFAGGAGLPGACSHFSDLLDRAEPDGDTAGRERAVRTIAALEQWLDAIHVSRTEPRA